MQITFHSSQLCFLAMESTPHPSLLPRLAGAQTRAFVRGGWQAGGQARGQSAFPEVVFAVFIVFAVARTRDHDLHHTRTHAGMGRQHISAGQGRTQ